MDESQVPQPDETPQPNPVAPPPPEQAPATTGPTDAQLSADAGFMRAYTQSQQKLAAVATALGVSKTSTAEQFVAAIETRRQAAAIEADELEKDPRLAARMAEIRAREQRIAQAQYGASADLAMTLYEAARAGSSPLDLAAIVDQHVIEAAASRFSGSPAQAGGTPPPAPTQGQPQPQQAPERGLVGDVPRGNDGMVDPGITPDRERGASGFFADLFAKGFRSS